MYCGLIHLLTYKFPVSIMVTWCLALKILVSMLSTTPNCCSMSHFSVYVRYPNLVSNFSNPPTSSRYPTNPLESGETQVDSVPLSIAMTEFHFILLYKDRIRAICHLNDEIVYEEMINLVCIVLFANSRRSSLRKWF